MGGGGCFFSKPMMTPFVDNPLFGTKLFVSLRQCDTLVQNKVSQFAISVEDPLSNLCFPCIRVCDKRAIDGLLNYGDLTSLAPLIPCSETIFGLSMTPLFGAQVKYLRPSTQPS